MNTRTIKIGSIQRITAAGEIDEILLKPGVNVIVGLKDTGKSGWLNTISFLLGDTDNAEKSLGENIALKFDSAKLDLIIGETEDVTLERRWKEYGNKHKIFVNGEAIQSKEFSEWLYTKLDIPILHFPKGNPYSGATWPELSWRYLFRHIYREERFWSDLADKQLDREQHACLLQFLGGAEKLYPKELNDGIQQRESLLRLRARKEQFEEVLQQATRGLISDTSISNAPTRDSIDNGVERIQAEISELRRQREALLSDTITSRQREPGETADSEITLSERRIHLLAEREQIDKERIAMEKRLAELSSYRTNVSAELTRIKRVEVAGELFKPLSVSQCPNCDQKITAKSNSAKSCFVCHQTLPADLTNGWGGVKQRLAFEQEQLQGEEEELEELIQNVRVQLTELANSLRHFDEEVKAIEVLLRPARTAIAAILPPELGIYDTKIGQLEERVAQLLRLRETIDQRDQLTSDIDELAAKVQVTSSQVDTKAASIQFEEMSDLISDGINEYLNLLKAGDAERWAHKPVRFQITERNFKLKVGESLWSTVVGASSGGLLLLGYHYALLKLSGRDGYNYPGLALIDFPMTLADGVSIANKENYLVEPFIDLANINPNIQVVICGRAFTELKGANRIPLDDVWTDDFRDAKI